MKRFFSLNSIKRNVDLFKSALEEAKASTTKPTLTDLIKSEPSNGHHLFPIPRADHYIFSTGNFDTSPWKCTVVAHMLKGMSWKQASAQLKFINRKPAHKLSQLMHRVGHVMEHNYKKDKDRLEIVRTWVGKGMYFKDMRLHSKGRVGKMTHPFAHINVEFRIIPDGIPIEHRLDGTRRLSEFEKIWDRLKRNKLQVPLKEKNGMVVPFDLWSKPTCLKYFKTKQTKQTK